MSRRRFAVLDRDGTIIEERHYLADPDQVQLTPGAAAGLRRMIALGLGLVVVTNQSAVGRKLLDLATLERIHARLAELLAAEGIRLDGIYVCPHTPEDGCTCRKPLGGMVEAASSELGFRAAESFVIGDKPCDIELGRRLGATTLLVRTGYGTGVAAGGEIAADYVVDNLAAAAAVMANLLAEPPKGAAPGTPGAC